MGLLLRYLEAHHLYTMDYHTGTGNICIRKEGHLDAPAKKEIVLQFESDQCCRQIDSEKVSTKREYRVNDFHAGISSFNLVT